MNDAYKKWQEDKNFIIDNDHLKEKSYIFSSFPTANKYGFQTGNIRPLLYGDVLARYERLLNKNVLYPVGFNTLAESSFIESRKSANVLNDNLAKTFLNQMLKLGIGVNDPGTTICKGHGVLTEKAVRERFCTQIEQGSFLETKNGWSKYTLP